MMQAKILNLNKAGYVFIAYELVFHECLSQTASAKDLEECDALDGLLDISLFVPDDTNYKNFSLLVREEMKNDPFNYTMPADAEVLFLNIYCSLFVKIFFKLQHNVLSLK